MNEEAHELPKEIGAPATQALLAAKITSLSQISQLSDHELLTLHGVGPKAIRILREHVNRRPNLKQK